MLFLWVLLMVSVPAYAEEKYQLDTYEVYLFTNRPPTNITLFIGLTTIGIISAISLGTYSVLYYKIFKYPLPVRKVRSYRKKLKKKNKPGIAITQRDNAFNKLLLCPIF